MRALSFLLLLPLAGCGGWGGNGPACTDDGDCDGDAICDPVNNSCRVVDCLTSEQCGLGANCSPELHTCVTGCATDSDCLAGETCTTLGQCEPYGCRSTELDCHYGEVCNGVGQCLRDNQPHCALANDFTSQYDCLYSYGGTLACWGDIVGSSCVGDTYCLLPCNPTGAECPRGTSCYAPFSNSNETFCTGDCPFLTANGF